MKALAERDLVWRMCAENIHLELESIMHQHVNDENFSLYERRLGSVGERLRYMYRKNLQQASIFLTGVSGEYNRMVGVLRTKGTNLPLINYWDDGS